jgi:hypothetical protein
VPGIKLQVFSFIWKYIFVSFQGEMSNENPLLEYREIVMKLFNSEDEGFEF